MTTQTKSPSQGLLFSEPAYSETGVWCQLNEGIDPAQWAEACRYLGTLTPNQFQEARKRLFSQKNEVKSSIINNKSSIRRSPDSLFSRLKRIFCFNQADFDHIPLVSIGPEGINA